MKTMSKILTAAFVLLLANKSFAQANASATGTANATIVTPIAITAGDPLDFGNVAIHATNSGTVTMPLSGPRTYTGGVTLPATTGTIRPATFNVTGDGSRSFIVTLPTSATLSDGSSNSMTVNNFVSTYGTTGAAGTLSSGTATFSVGATLNVTGGQAAGTYSGTYVVTVDYQ